MRLRLLHFSAMTLWLLLIAILAAPLPARAQVAQTPPYQPQLLRLSELMGALHYLRGLCGFADAPAWRDKANALIEGQGLEEADRARFAGAFNRGYRTFQVTYRSCDEAAGNVVRNYLNEADAIVKDLDTRYGR